MRVFSGLVALAVCTFVLAACETEPAPIDRYDERAAIRSLLDEQQEAWNRGDVEAFMQGYRQVDTLRFASGGTVRTGWQETLDAYLRNYPDRAAMGTLAFDSLDVRILSPRWAMAFGRWRLDRANDTPQGLFTLVLHRPTRSDPWRIVHDHTSSASSP
jgi:ketosteroid isomerase-like protein